MILSGPLVGLGRPGLLLRKQGGWLVLWCLACVVGAGVGLVAWWWHRRRARCCLVWWWWVSPLVGGGMLSGFWGSAPWLPGPPFLLLYICWGVGVGVGGLVVNCIVDASILL